MAAFQYSAITSSGEKQKGIIEADNDKHARRLLRTSHLTPLELSLVRQKTSKNESGKVSLKQSMSHKELTLMTRQFATLIAAGLPIEEVLTAIAEQTEKPSIKGLIISVRSKVVDGHALASALRDFPHAFSNLYCATVAAGEKSGHLDIVLQRLADYTESQFHTRQKIQNALIYPSLMVLVSVGIVGFLLEYVVPKMIAVYSNLGQTLPTMTQVLISISFCIQHVGIYFLLIIISSIYIFRRILNKNKAFREKFHRFLLHLPLFGNAIKTINTARFSRTFAILSSAGVPVLEAMSIASALVTTIPIRKAIETAAKRVREGININVALKQTTFFPPMSLHLIASGEASGQLENMLERAATNQENDITGLIETSLSLFEPAIILLMGAIVLFIVLAVLLPIFQLNQLTG